MLTDEQREILSMLGTWNAPHVPSWPRGKLILALTNALLARQRDRDRCKRAGRLIVYWRNKWLEEERRLQLVAKTERDRKKAALEARIAKATGRKW